jgi:hypothetical protein
VIGLALAVGAELKTPGSVGLQAGCLIASTLTGAGGVAGLFFGLLLLIVEGRKRIESPTRLQAAVLGALAGGLSQALLFDQMTFSGACVLGLIGAVASTALLRRAQRSKRATA